MPEPFPWGRKSQFSIGGIEVVPETGLEVAYDDSPEVVPGELSKPKRKLSFPKWEVKKIVLRRAPGFWMGMAVAVFGLGIGASVIFALVAGVKARDGHPASSARSSSTSPSLISIIGTTKSTSQISTSSSFITSASTAAPSTFVTSIVTSPQLSQSSSTFSGTTIAVSPPVYSVSTNAPSTSASPITLSFFTSITASTTRSTTPTAVFTSVSASTSSYNNNINSPKGQTSSSSSSSGGGSSTTNFQTFKGALGGAHAIAITSTGNSQIPFKVAGTSFPDLPSAASKSCILQRQTCEGISNDGSGSVTVSECLTQFSQCLAATPGATG